MASTKHTAPTAPRRTLLEQIMAGSMVEVPNSRLAVALRSAPDEDWFEWLSKAADRLGWVAERVDAPPAAVIGERESWWVTCAPEGPERWLVLTGQRGERSRAALLDGATAKEVPTSAASIAQALDLPDGTTPTTWVRLVPALPLEGLRKPTAEERPKPQRRLRRWVSIEKKTLLAVVVYSAVIGAISLALPLAVQSLVNSLAFGRVLQPLLVISLGLLLLLSLAAALRVLEVYIVELLQRRVFVDVARDVARRLPSALPEAGGPWGLTERINRFFDVVGAQKSASSLLLSATEVVMSTFAGLLVLAFYHPYLLVFDLVLLASLAFVIFRLGSGGVHTAVEESHAKYELAAWLESIARRQHRFASPEGAAWGTRQTERLVVDWLTERAAHFSIVMRQTIGFAAVQAIASAGLLGLGSFLVWKGQLSLGQLVASELIITGVLAQLAKFGKHVESFYDLNASVDKIGTLLDVRTESAEGELLEDVERGVEVEAKGLEVCGRPCALSAQPAERIALCNMHHRVRHELFGMIYGTHAPEQGNLHLDGAPVTALAPRTRRHQITLVTGAMPVGGTLEENLTSQDARSTAPELRRLLSEVGLGELLDELPDGLETWVFPDGRPLSRAQLVALDVARAILRRPRLMLVEHALDGLDEAQLAPVWRALTDDAPWTLLVATDRPDISRRCERVYSWTDGALEEARA